MKKRHYFHILVSSPWPLFSSLSAFIVAVGLAMYMHSYFFGLSVLMFGLFLVMLSMFVWWRDVFRENLFEGKHTRVVKKSLSLGMFLFIISEVMFFFSFFWAFFHGSLSPGIEFGCIWPPIGIDICSVWSIPFVNTITLLLSGVTVTSAHYFILCNKFNKVNLHLVLTLSLSKVFSSLQYAEYTDTFFEICDGFFASVFYIITGLHGFHVMIGTFFLFICLERNRHFLLFFNRHLDFLFAAWYWHFVDVVWLFLFLTIYWWGG